MRQLLPPLVLAALLTGATAGIIPEAEQHRAETRLHDALSDPETAEEALEAVMRRADALRRLEEVAVHGTDLSARGRAILAIQGIEGDEADAVLRALADGDHPELVRTWAAAARVNRAPDLPAYLDLADAYMGRYPALARPFELRAAALLQGADLDELLALVARQPNLAPAAAPLILAAPAERLVRLMQTHPDDPVRRQAAAYLASKAQRSDSEHREVSRAVRDALAYTRRAERLPWEGGALYVPGIGWQRAEAVDLVRLLILWNLHCDRIGAADAQRQVQNNLRSVQLLRAAGFSNAWPDVNGPEVLVEYGRVAGRKAVEEVLERTGMRDSRWARALTELGGR